MLCYRIVYASVPGKQDLCICWYMLLASSQLPASGSPTRSGLFLLPRPNGSLDLLSGAARNRPCTASIHGGLIVSHTAGAGQRRKPKDDKGKLSRPNSGKVFSSLDTLTVRMPGGSAVHSPRASEPSAAEARPALVASASAPAASAQPAATVPLSLVPTTAPLPPLGAATAAAAAATGKAGTTPSPSPGAMAVTANGEKGGADGLPGVVPDQITENPDEVAKQPVSKSGPGKPDGSKAHQQNGRRITTRYEDTMFFMRPLFSSTACLHPMQ